MRPCVRCGLYLVTEDARRTAVLVRAPAPEFGRELASVQLVSTDPQAAARAAAEIRAASLEHNVFRGQVLSFGREVFERGHSLLRFHRGPDSFERSDPVVLPDGVPGGGSSVR